jgi:HlyD family secretion protein
MSARVELATVKKEEHGTLVGVLASVSEFPMSREGIASILQNDELVNTFAAAGPPYAARIDLESDPRAPSGYRWTSTPGPDTPVTAGTTLRAEISVREQRPIALMVPAMKKAIGVY